MNDYRMSEWVDVKNQLPNSGVKILVSDCKTGKIGLGEYDPVHGWSGVCSDIARPTHWMLLPDPLEDTNRRCENCRYWTRYGKVCQNTKSPFFSLVTDMSRDWCMYWMPLDTHHECIVETKMNKLLLILNASELNNNCLNCPCHYEYVDGVGCNVMHKDIDCEYIPKWCPLRPMPEHITQTTGQDMEYWRGYMYGWNRCLDVMEGNDCLEAADLSDDDSTYSGCLNYKEEEKSFLCGYRGFDELLGDYICQNDKSKNYSKSLDDSTCNDCLDYTELKYWTI